MNELYDNYGNPITEDGYLLDQYGNYILDQYNQPIHYSTVYENISQGQQGYNNDYNQEYDDYNQGYEDNYKSPKSKLKTMVKLVVVLAIVGIGVKVGLPIVQDKISGGVKVEKSEDGGVYVDAHRKGFNLLDIRTSQDEDGNKNVLYVATIVGEPTMDEILDVAETIIETEIPDTDTENAKKVVIKLNDSDDYALEGATLGTVILSKEDDGSLSVDSSIKSKDWSLKLTDEESKTYGEFAKYREDEIIQSAQVPMEEDIIKGYAQVSGIGETEVKRILNKKATWEANDRDYKEITE